MLAKLFRKKRRHYNSPGYLEETTRQTDKEARHTCRQCGLELSGPEAIRCPRCFALATQHGCGGCGRCSH